MTVGKKLHKLNAYQTCIQELAELLQSNPNMVEAFTQEDIAVSTIIMRSGAAFARETISAIMQRRIAQRDEMELFIANVQDPLIQEVLVYHCALGYSWEQVAQTIEGDYSPSYLEQIVEQYFQDQKIA